MFDRRSTVIRDGSRLDYAYVPKNLVHREEQMARLETLFRPLAMDGRACTAFLTGGVGTGKTVTARRFCEDMAAYMAGHGRPVDTIYVNCRNASEAGALLQMIRHYDRGFPERGFSTEEMARILANHLATNSRGLVVILDEVDVLLRKGSTDIVYQLTRARTSQSAPVSVIMASQEPVESLLDEASMSTFRRSNTVRFNRYSRQELREIAAARAEEALYAGTYSEDALDLIAEEAAEYGDARMAIELLDRAANMAEDEDEGEMTTEHVRAAKAMIYSSVSDSKLRSLDLNHKLVLLAIARAMKKNLSIQSSAAEKTYAIVCEEYGVQARKHTQFWSYVKDLDSIGVIGLATVNDSTGRVSVISLPDIPSKVLAQKMEALLDGDDDDGLRHLRARRGHVRQVQRDAPVRGALPALRRQEGQARDPQAGRRLPRRPHSRGGLRRQGQHGRPEDVDLGVQRLQRRGGPRHHHRRGDRGLPPPERRRGQEVLLRQRRRAPRPLVLRAGGLHGRDSPGVRGVQPLHLLRRVPQDAHERRGQGHRRQVPGHRPQPGRHGPVRADELRPRGRGAPGPHGPARDRAAGAGAEDHPAEADPGEGDAALRDPVWHRVLGRRVPLLGGGPAQPVPRRGRPAGGPLARRQVRDTVVLRRGAPAAAPEPAAVGPAPVPPLR